MESEPQNDRSYEYFKYYMLVTYLLDHDKLTVEQLFTRDINQANLEDKVLTTL